MNDVKRKIWEKLDENIGHCILYKEAAMKEVLGEEILILQFATLSPPERVETFLKGNIRFNRKEYGNYTFDIDGVKVEVRCYDTKRGLEKTYENIFSRKFRCENLGINIRGQYNNNKEAYDDILAKELHFASADTKLTDLLIGKLLKYVLICEFSIGDDILDDVATNNTFKNRLLLIKYLGILADYVRNNKCTWKRVVEALKLIKAILPNSDFIKYTAGLTEEMKDDKFIRNYLYNLFLSLDMTAQELQNVMPNEPTLEYFDSLVINASASLRKYDVYMSIKEKYGEEFLELLKDLQESIASSFGEKYIRVSEETFDMGEMFFKDERFWCSFEKIKKSSAIIDKQTVEEPNEETMDVSKGSVSTWTNEQYDAEMYSEENETSKDKHYLDDEDEEQKTDTGLNMSEIDSYEAGNVTENDVQVSEKSHVSHVNEDEIMNSQRGHESKVLNSGGM